VLLSPLQHFTKKKEKRPTDGIYHQHANSKHKAILSLNVELPFSLNMKHLPVQEEGVKPASMHIHAYFIEKKKSLI
jgi:hypothetical protein